jgi:mono/diheme cytochrome c family protein
VRGFVNGIIFTLALILAAAVVGAWQGVLPAGADAKPLPFEEWAAKRSLHASIARDGAGAANPVESSDDNLLAGVKLYGANCAVCHGAADAKPSNLAQGFYVEAPQLAKDGVEDDPESVTHWKLVHGIRFTAMPAFQKTLGDDDLWKLTLFLKQMDKLPPVVDAAWKALPSAAASPSPSPSESPSPSP